jgi:hypothetical protein
MADLETAGEPVTPDWLTAVLRRAGVLPFGAVLTVLETPNAAFNSRITHLTLEYSVGAPPTAPRRLLVKRSLAAPWAVRAGASEVGFYRLAASLPAPLPMIASCSAAEHDTASGASYLLLRDLSATHHPPLTRDQQLTPGANVPAALDLERTIAALARLHAYWWEHPRLGTGVAQVNGWLRDRLSFERLIQRHTEDWEGLLRDEGDRFPADLRRLYERVLARLPRLWERYLGPGSPLFPGSRSFTATPTSPTSSARTIRSPVRPT